MDNTSTTDVKARKEHRVPLTHAAMEIIGPLSQARVSDWVFPGQRHNRHLSATAMKMLLRRMQIEDATPHGFRSSFRDWAGDETSVAREIAEGCLAHSVGNRAERAYRRGDALEKRRSLLEAWANFCEPSLSTKVIPIQGYKELPK